MAHVFFFLSFFVVISLLLSFLFCCCIVWRHNRSRRRNDWYGGKMLFLLTCCCLCCIAVEFLVSCIDSCMCDCSAEQVVGDCVVDCGGGDLHWHLRLEHSWFTVYHGLFAVGRQSIGAARDHLDGPAAARVFKNRTKRRHLFFVQVDTNRNQNHCDPHRSVA